MRPVLPRWLIGRKPRKASWSVGGPTKATLAQRVNAFILREAREKKVRGIDLPVVSNRAEARVRLRGRGPFMHFQVQPDPARTRKPGRTRTKREAQRERLGT